MAVEQVNFNSKKLSLNVGNGSKTSFADAQKATLRNNSIFTLAAAKNGKNSEGVSADADQQAKSKGFSLSSLFGSSKDGANSSKSTSTSESQTKAAGAVEDKSNATLKAGKTKAVKEGNAFKKQSEQTNKKLQGIQTEATKKAAETEKDVAELTALNDQPAATPAAQPAAQTQAPAQANPFAQEDDSNGAKTSNPAAQQQAATTSASAKTATADPNADKKAALTTKIGADQSSLKGFGTQIKSISRIATTTKAQIDKSLAGLSKTSKELATQSSKTQKAAAVTVQVGGLTQQIGSDVTGLATTGHVVAKPLMASLPTAAAGLTIEHASLAADPIGKTATIGGGVAKTTGLAVQGKTMEALMSGVSLTVSTVASTIAGNKSSAVTKAFTQLGSMAVNTGLKYAQTAKKAS